MNLKPFLIVICSLLAISMAYGQAPKPKPKSKSTTDSKTSKKSSSKKGKKGGKDDTFKSDRNRDKKQDTQSMLQSQGGGKKDKSPNYVSKTLFYNGRQYTGTIEHIPGYRLCIYTGSNRVDAMKAKVAFNTRFRTMRSYMSYNLPNYKIKVGDYEDKKAALRALKDIQASFPAAFVSPDKITVVRRQLYVKPQPVSPTDANALSTDVKSNTSKKLSSSNSKSSNSNSEVKPKPKMKEPVKPATLTAD